MEQLLKTALDYWATWLFGLISAGLVAGYRRLANRVKADDAERKAIKEGLLAILHDRLYQACQHYIDQGRIDTTGLKNIEYLYSSYHKLGGNGTGTELYNRAKSLPIHDN
jgi:hypothetical protein